MKRSGHRENAVAVTEIAIRASRVRVILPLVDLWLVVKNTRAILGHLTRPADVFREHETGDSQKKEQISNSSARGRACEEPALLAWLRQSPAKPNSRHMLEHIQRLRALQALYLPAGTERQVHQNRLLKIAREGGQMTSADLAKFETQRRYATLVAVAVEATATVTDEVIDLHDRIVGKLVNTAKHKHQEQFQTLGKAINDKVLLYGRIGQVLLDAEHQGGDTFAANRISHILGGFCFQRD